MYNNNLTKTTELTLDKTPKKWYNQNSIVQANPNVFDNDEIANSALDYLYSNDNQNKTQSFLKNNGFPSAQEREYNKELYGVQEEQKNMQNLLKNKTNSILNPTLPNDTDRAFLKGLMGDEEEERDYQKQVARANSAVSELKNAFSGSRLESQLKGYADSAMQTINFEPTTESGSFDAKNGIGHIDNFNLLQEYDTNNAASLYLRDAKNTLSMVNPRASVADNFGGIFVTAKQAFRTFENSAYETQKNVQRGIWRAGSQYYLRNRKKYYTSAWMLEHSLQDNPSDIWRGNDSRIAYLINNDRAYLNKLDEAIKQSKDGTIDTDLKGIQFNYKDLYYSIHKADIHVSGYLQSNGKWIVHATLSDKYDFTEFMTFMDDNGGWSTQASLGTVANDAAHISQKLGAINPYHVTVDFYTTR